MAKTKSTKQTVSSDRKDSFFVRAKNNAVSKKSKGFTPKKQENTFFKGKKRVSKTNDCDSGFYAKKSESSQFDQADSNDQRKPTVEKKPFDKKKWRTQKYSKKYKLQQWEEKRKKVVSREYYKQVKDDQPGFDVQKLYAEESEQDDDNEEGSVPSEQDQGKKTKRNLTVQNRYEQARHEKEEKKATALRKKEERKVALEAYKKKKHEKFKKLNMKNKKGQPIMKHRMEMLLEQIQKTCT